MLKGCAKAGLLDGGGRASGRGSGGNLRRERGKEVILTEGLEVVMASLLGKSMLDTQGRGGGILYMGALCAKAN
jgi:hypothetical protein